MQHLHYSPSNGPMAPISLSSDSSLLFDYSSIYSLSTNPGRRSWISTTSSRIIDDAEEQHKLLFITIICSTAISFSVVGLRFWMRLRRRVFGGDDWAMLVAMIGTIGLLVLTFLAMNDGLCQRTGRLAVPQIKSLYTLVQVHPFLYVLVLGSIRISVLLLYRRVFGVQNRNFRRIIDFVIYLSILCTVAAEIGLLFQCGGVKATFDIWSRMLVKCSDVQTVIYVLSIVHITFYFIVVMLPMGIIRRLQISGREKIKLIILLLVGGLGFTFAIARLLYFQKVLRHRDFFYWPPIFIYTHLEIALIMVLSSAPVIHTCFAPLFSCCCIGHRKDSTKPTRQSPVQTIGGGGPGGVSRKPTIKRDFDLSELQSPRSFYFERASIKESEKPLPALPSIPEESFRRHEEEARRTLMPIQVMSPLRWSYGSSARHSQKADSTPGTPRASRWN